MAEKSNTNERILNAAKELFYKQGYNDTTIRQIQKKSDNSSIHYYYKNKKDIAYAIFIRYLDLIDSSLTTVASLQNDDLLYQMTRSVLFFSTIMNNENDRKFYLESLRDCKSGYTAILMDRKVNIMYNISKVYLHRDISLDTVKCYDLISLSAQYELFTGFFTGILNLSLDDAIGIQATLGPKLFGISDSIIEEKLAQAKAIAEQIDMKNYNLLS